MSNVPSNLRYTKEHEWVEEISPGRYRVGITDYAQGALGDIVYLQMPKVGETLESGRVCGEVESTKSVSEIYAPLSGTVTAINGDLDSAPETINTDPYGKGWLLELEASNLSQVGDLLSAESYSALTAWLTQTSTIGWALSETLGLGEGIVVAAADSRKDLTTTIHLTALRSVESSLNRLIEESGPELIEVLNGLSGDAAMLVSLIGPNKGARYLLEQGTTRIGRATTNEIFLDDVTVSRKHAEIAKDGKDYLLRDLGSLNGSYLNGELIGEVNLSDGDELQIGKFRMHFFTGGKVRS